jgi:excisionase family DNA binding protein
VTRLLSLAEVAQVLRVSTRTVQRLVAIGTLREGPHYVRVGRQLRFREAAVMAALTVVPRSGPRPAVSDALRAELE